MFMAPENPVLVYFQQQQNNRVEKRRVLIEKKSDENKCRRDCLSILKKQTGHLSKIFQMMSNNISENERLNCLIQIRKKVN